MCARPVIPLERLLSEDLEVVCRDLDFEPKTPIEQGLPRFVAWYRDYHGV